MPKLPDVDQIQRAIPQGRSSVTSLDTRGVGAGIDQVSRQLADYADRKAKVELAEAEADFMTEKARLEGGLDEDKDYETLTVRHEQGLQEALSASAAKIRNPEYRNLFVQKLRASVESSKQTAQNYAWDTEKRVKISEFDSRMDQLREVGLKGDVTEAMGTMRSLIDSYVDMGYIPEDKRAELIKKSKVDLVVGKLKMMPPENRVEALKQPAMRDNLPTDTYAELMREAEEHQILGKAQSAVDGMRSKGLGQLAGDAYIRKHYSSNPKLREAVQKEWDYTSQKMRQAKNEQESQLLDAHYDKVRSGTMTVDAFKEAYKADWVAMGATGQNNLYAAERQFAAGLQDAPFSYAVETGVSALISNGQIDAAEEFYNENYASMSNSQQARLGQVLSDVKSGGDVKDALTLTQAVGAQLDKNNLSRDKQASGAVLDAVQRWYNLHVDQNKRAPDPIEIDKQISYQISKLELPWQSDPRIYNMTQQQKLNAVEKLRRSDPKGMRIISDTIRKTGVDPDTVPADQVLQLYQEMKAMGIADVED